ncbi:hypothetical protein [Kitasatospora camelliae]|uniref:Helix-turn-helix protein n=1 Tax=Kitasatospora camelliae TaxID=3156397 RepID=A0AAU8K6D1_9ACTN
MDDVLRTGPFHAALRWAIATRGLSLDRLCERLAARGPAVSVSTLSNWQRGTSLPRRAESLRAVAALESVLDLPERTLARLLAEPGRRGRTLAPGTPRRPAVRLRAQLDQPADPGLEVLAVQQDVTVSAAGWQAAVRTVVRSRRPGVDRYVVLSHSSGGDLPEIRAGGDCTLGRTRTDPGAALVAAELLFAPLGRNETIALEHRVAGRTPEPYYGSWFREAGRYFELTLRFAPDAGARRAWRIWRTDSASPHRDLTELRLIDGRLAHLAEFEPTPGFHGLRWTG